MFKLIVCNTQFFAWDDDALKRAKNATKRGNKNKWKYNLPGNRIFLHRLSLTKRKEFTFLSWNGSESAYLLFRLTENTRLVAGQIDIEPTNTHWLDIWKHYLAYQNSVRDIEHWQDKDPNIQKAIANNLCLSYYRLLNPLKHII